MGLLSNVMLALSELRSIPIRLDAIERRLEEILTLLRASDPFEQWRLVIPKPAPARTTTGVTLTIPCPPGQCQYPTIWHGTTPPSCSKCGKVANDYTLTY